MIKNDVVGVAYERNNLMLSVSRQARWAVIMRAASYVHHSVLTDKEVEDIMETLVSSIRKNF